MMLTMRGEMMGMMWGYRGCRVVMSRWDRYEDVVVLRWQLGNGVMLYSVCPGDTYEGDIKRHMVEGEEFSKMLGLGWGRGNAWMIKKVDRSGNSRDLMYVNGKSMLWEDL